MRERRFQAVTIVALVLLLLPALYLGSYLALLRPTTQLHFDRGGNYHLLRAEYRLGGAWAKRFYMPAHAADRLIRPEYWDTVQ